MEFQIFTCHARSIATIDDSNAWALWEPADALQAPVAVMLDQGIPGADRASHTHLPRFGIASRIVGSLIRSSFSANTAVRSNANFSLVVSMPLMKHSD